MAEEKIEVWQTRLKMYQKAQEKYRTMWKRFKDYYKNNYFGVSPYASRAADTVSVNMLFANISQILPGIYARNPTILVQPRKPDDVVNARIVETVLNYQLEEINFRAEAELAILDALLFGLGYVQVGYELKMGLGDATTQFNEYVKSESVWAVRKSPWEVIVPTTDARLENMPYVLIRESKYIEDVKNDPQYSNTKDLNPSGRVQVSEEMNDDSLEADMQQKDNEKRENDRVFLWTIFDKRTGRKMTMAQGHDKWLQNDVNKLEIEGFPLVKVDFNPVPDEYYPIADPQQYEPQLIEKNLLRTQMNIHFKRMARKFLVKTGMLSTEDMDKLTSPDDAAVLEMDNIDESIIRVMEQAPIPPDNYTIESLIDRDINILSGVSEYERGVRGEGRRTATEANIASSASSLRQAFRLNKVNDFVKQVASKLLQLDRQFYTTDRIVKIVGPKGIEWMKYNKDQLQGEYDITIQAASSAPLDKNVRRREMLELYSLLANDPNIDAIRLRSTLLEEFNLDPQTLIKQQEPQAQDPLAAMVANGQEPQNPVEAAKPAQGMKPLNARMNQADILGSANASL